MGDRKTSPPESPSSRKPSGGNGSQPHHERAPSPTRGRLLQLRPVTNSTGAAAICGTQTTFNPISQPTLSDNEHHNKPKTSMDARDQQVSEDIVAATTTLQWLQNQCLEQKVSDAIPKMLFANDTLRALTRLSKFMLRTPNETVAVSLVRNVKGVTLIVSQNDNSTDEDALSIAENEAQPGAAEFIDDTITLGDMMIRSIVETSRRQWGSRPARMHVDRLKRIAAGTFKIAPGESDVGQGKIERKFVYLRQYLTAASSRLFWKQAKVSFDNPGCTWKLPPLRDSGHDNGQGPDAHRRERYAAMRWFHLHNEEIRGEDNNSRIRKAFRLVGHSAHTMNPMREAIFGAPGDESDNPDRKKIDKARKQKLDEVMEECEDEFRRISAMTVKVWANVTVATKSATSPAEHIKMLQEAIKEEAATADMRTRFLEYGQQDNSATMTYLEFLSLLVYTTRVMVKYFTYMLRMWVEHTNYMSSPTDMDKDLMRQIGRTVMALSNAQAIWYQLIRSPRTTAWALHLLQRPEWVISRTTAKSTGQDKAARYSIPDDDASADEGGGFDDGDEAAKTLDVPGIVEETIHNIDTTVVRRMMRSFFRLGAVTYQQRQAEKDIMPSFIQGSQNQFDIKFIPNMDEKHYGPGELRKFVKSYWEKLDARFSREPHWTGSKLLAELSSSQYFQDGNKELKLFTTSTARAHCESIIMVDWYEKHGKTKALPPIGISRAACGTCSILLYEVLHEAESGEFPNPERIVTGIGRAFWTCMLPTRTPIELKLSVLEYLERRIEVYLGEAEVIQEIRRHVAKSKAKPVEEEPKHESSVVSVGASSREASSPESSPASYSDVESQGRDDSDSF